MRCYHSVFLESFMVLAFLLVLCNVIVFVAVCDCRLKCLRTLGTAIVKRHRTIKTLTNRHNDEGLPLNCLFRCFLLSPTISLTHSLSRSHPLPTLPLEQHHLPVSSSQFPILNAQFLLSYAWYMYFFFIHPLAEQNEIQMLGFSLYNTEAHRLASIQQQPSSNAISSCLQSHFIYVSVLLLLASLYPKPCMYTFFRVSFSCACACAALTE